MCAFTCDNVQDALSEMVGRRIEVIEKRETGCYSHLFIKTYDRWSALVDGRGSPSPPTLIGLKVRLSQMSLGPVKRDGTL